MALIGQILLALVSVYMGALIARMVLSWIPVVAPAWQPKGALLVLAEGVYTVTDPPIRLLDRWIPPLRIGQVALSLSFLIVWFGLLILQQVIARIFF